MLNRDEYSQRDRGEGRGLEFEYNNRVNERINARNDVNIITTDINISILLIIVPTTTSATIAVAFAP